MNPIQLQKLTHKIRHKGLELGFDAVAFAKAEKMDQESRLLEKWLSQGFHGQMKWMENHFELRTDPTKLVPGARTVIMLSHNYFPNEEPIDPSAPKISRYAYGKDYHKVLRKKVKSLLRWIHSEIGDINGRCFVDSGPVMERDWAKRSGLAWSGKNTLSIHPKRGSWFFLATLIVDLELEYDHPIKDYCGTCRRCIDACPTDAFSENGYILDARKCISYLTIELKDEIPELFAGKMASYVFGCDICQEVCPWNRFARPHQEPDFTMSEQVRNMSAQEWEEITEEVFQKLFRHTPVKRAKWTGLKRNLDFLKKTGNY